MHTRKALQQQFEQALKAQNFPADPPELYEPFSYILGLGGKRLRPVLVLMGCDLFGGDIEEAIDPALALELFHNFTLIHDDIMDEAPIRRGQPTVHKQFNTNIAILSGDVMLVYAYRYISKLKPPVLQQVLAVFHDTAIKVCEGQQYDMNFEQREDVSIAEYLDMISLKTAVLLAGALKIGAYTGGADESDAQRLYDFGKHLGLAFQLQDDLLDTYGESGDFGKQVGGDIIQNKKTFLWLKALELADEAQRAVLVQWSSAQEFDPAEKVKAVKAVYNALDIKSLTGELMQEHYGMALAALDEIAVPEAHKQTLRQLAEALMSRQT